MGYHPEIWQTWGSESLPPDRILHRCGTDRWYSVHTMDAHGEEGWPACKGEPGWSCPKNRFLRGIYLLVQRYLRHNVGMQGAALAFYLLFMIFPPADLCQLPAGPAAAGRGCHSGRGAGVPAPRRSCPSSGVYLTYVGRNPSVKLLLFGLFFSLYFPMRATNTLMRSVRIAYHLGPPRGALPQLVKTLLYGGADRHHRPDPDADVCGETGCYSTPWTASACPGSGRCCGRSCGSRWRRWQGISPCSSCTPCLRTAASPGGTSGPALMAALGAWLALNWLYSTYVENFADYSPAVRLHRHGHRPFDLAVYDRRDPHHGGGAERHADLPAKGPGGGIVNDF